MASHTAEVFRRAVRLVAHADGAAVSDQELLRRFVRANDQAAFATLVSRHGGMVLGVCRRALGNVHDAEDAAQATFLVLAQKASGVSWRPSIANWLHATG